MAKQPGNRATGHFLLPTWRLGHLFHAKTIAPAFRVMTASCSWGYGHFLHCCDTVNLALTRQSVRSIKPHVYGLLNAIKASVCDHRVITYPRTNVGDERPFSKRNLKYTGAKESEVVVSKRNVLENPSLSTWFATTNIWPFQLHETATNECTRRALHLDTDAFVTLAEPHEVFHHRRGR